VKDLVDGKKLDAKRTDDPWGHPYRIVCDDEGGELRVYSNGKDGKENTPDDIRDDFKEADVKRVANL
jgi:general secretion pathway protein G